MKVASLIVALTLALTWGVPVRPAPISGAANPIATTALPTSGIPSTPESEDDSEAAAVLGPSNYLLLALGLFGMGLVSRRRQPD